MSFKRSLLATAALSALCATPAVYAQQITSQIAGTVVSPAGSPVAGETVIVTDTRTGTRRTSTTSSNGTFFVRNLAVGGPYSVRVQSQSFEDYLLTDIYLDVSGRSNYTIALSEADAGVEEIRVTAAASNFQFTALGPSTSFNLAEIRSLPSISRNVNDIIRVDPRVNIQGQNVSCLGANNRFNAFTIDGVRAGDPFGLNGTGNLSRNTFPIPFDGLGSASVEFAPVDVQYGQFQGCQINVTSQSGTNEFHGGAFFLYNNQDLQGDRIEGVNNDDPLNIPDFDRFNWGADLGGPIIKDKLFFYVAYEEFDTALIQDEGPGGLGFAQPLTNLDQSFSVDEINRFGQILADVYGRDPDLLVPVFTNPRTNRRFFGRIDWNINENHRLEASYARVDEFNQESDDLRFDRFTFRDNFEEEGSASDTGRVALFSDWSDRFSTEIRISRQEVQDNQGPVGGGEALDNPALPRLLVLDPGDTSFSIFDDGLVSGPGIFRSANTLQTQTDQIKVAGFYDADDHQITFGYELDSLDVFNLFIVNGTGTIFFDDLDALEAGQASAFDISAAFSGNAADAAAEFRRDIHSIYLQDEWSITEDLTLIAGLRYDYFDVNSAPTNNPVFQSRYGFSNTANFDGLDVWLPRLGLNWTAPEDVFGQTSFRAGFGVFSVAGPTVWLSNAFSNFGGAIGDTTVSLADPAGCTPSDFQVSGSGNIFPACAVAAAAAEANGFTARTDAVDPNFELPSVARFSVGVTHYTDTGIDFFDDWTINADFIYSNNRNSQDFVDLTLSPSGELTPDGRPLLIAVNPDLPGCNAVFQGPRAGFANVTPECDAGGDDQDILLTNVQGSSGRAINVSFQAQKDFQLGDVTNLDFAVGYAYSDVTLATIGTSSTATSNFEATVSNVPNNVPLAPANFQNAHNITIRVNLEHDFFEDLTTSMGIFFRATEGNPFSYTFDADTAEDFFGDSDDVTRILPYIPTGPNDPRVDFSQLSGNEQAALFSFLDETGLSEYAGGIAPRNAFTQPWTTDIDLRFQQELPGFFSNDRFTLFVDVENFLNLIDSGAGVQEEIETGTSPEGVPFVGVAGLNENGQYILQNFERPVRDVFTNQTLWRINLGIRYDF